MTLPTFLIIGAQKCGTTSLYNYLTQHPQIAPAAKKELHFFDIYFNRGMKWYKSKFPKLRSQEGVVTGEASPYYIFHPHAAQRILKCLPDVKLIVLLRNPVERAISHYYHNQRTSNNIQEPLSFEEAIQQESARIKPELEKMLADKNYKSYIYRHYGYLSRGIYIEQLTQWMKLFPREQLLILKSEDLAEKTPETVGKVLEFLELPQIEITGYEKANLGENKENINEETRTALREYFQPYNRSLEEYLQRKFDWDYLPAEDKSFRDTKKVAKARSKLKAERPYVFAIGLNKCGTTSLDKAFKELGWHALHGPYKFNDAVHKAMKKGKKLLDFLPNFNMFSDIFYPFRGDEHPCMKPENRQEFLEMLDRQYPGSKFICNIRNKRDWLESRKRHVIKNKNNKDYKFKWLKIEEEEWDREYDIHYKIVFEYFQNRQDLLVMNFDESPSYETLCQFLEIPVLNKEFPRKAVSKKNVLTAKD